MIRDLGQYAGQDDQHYDLCIVGAGAAGLALAMEFIGTATRVCLLESGGLEYEDAVQDLYAGESVGLDYFPLDACRLRYFGGTTNHWAGYCQLFPDYAFDALPWIDHSGWPIRRDEILPYYMRCHDRMGLTRIGWEPGTGWQVDRLRDAVGHPGLAIDPDAFEDSAWTIEPIRMGETLRADLEAAPNIDVVLHANLFEIEVNQTASAVTGLDMRTPDNRRVTFRAGQYVVAAGGIETARLLLASNSTQTEGLGNGRDLVGRFFSDHPNLDPGYIQTTDRGIDAQLYDRVDLSPQTEGIFRMTTRIETMRAHGLTRGAVQLDRRSIESRGANSLRQILRNTRRGAPADDLGQHIANVVSDIGPLTDFTAEYLWYGQAPLDRIDIRLILLETAPNPDSRITLAEATDRLGMRRVRLDWRLSEIDERTLRFMWDRIAAGAATRGIGRARQEIPWEDYRHHIHGSNHNLGTARMADDPARGVVDANCRVHGIENLYLAGGAVFPTSGAGSPTIMIVALAIRLADHLKSRSEG